MGMHTCEWIACPLWDTLGPFSEVSLLLRAKVGAGGLVSLAWGVGGWGVGRNCGWALPRLLPHPGGRKPLETLRLLTTSICLCCSLPQDQGQRRGLIPRAREGLSLDPNSGL